MGGDDGGQVRPPCPCHGEPMDLTGDSRECPVKRRERRRAGYHADPEANNYARRRRELRARIRAKRALLEDHAEKN